MGVPPQCFAVESRVFWCVVMLLSGGGCSEVWKDGGVSLSCSCLCQTVASFPGQPAHFFPSNSSALVFHTHHSASPLDLLNAALFELFMAVYLLFLLCYKCVLSACCQQVGWSVHPLALCVCGYGTVYGEC